MHWLALMWVGIIGFCIVMYVILDGFTLGTGLLMPWMTPHERDIAMSVILPTWDGNQTWLVMGTAGLYGAFPLAFSLLLPILYQPLLLMAITLLFRGIVFEFRLKASQGKHYWDIAFFLASFLTTLIQGMILGNFVEGFDVNAHHLLVSDKGLMNYFSFFTAISLVFGYGLLSSTRLILKTEGPLQTKMFYFAKISAVAIAIASVVVSIWSPYINPHIAARWLNLQNWIYLAPLPLINGGAFLLLIWALMIKNDKIPYWSSVTLFLAPYLGFIASLYPFLIPYHIPFWEAAAPNNTLRFIFVGAAILLPALVFYTGYAYHIFRGKVKDVISY